MSMVARLRRSNKSLCRKFVFSGEIPRLGTWKPQAGKIVEACVQKKTKKKKSTVQDIYSVEKMFQLLFLINRETREAEIKQKQREAGRDG